MPYGDGRSNLRHVDRDELLRVLRAFRDANVDGIAVSIATPGALLIDEAQRARAYREGTGTATDGS